MSALQLHINAWVTGIAFHSTVILHWALLRSFPAHIGKATSLTVCLLFATSLLVVSPIPFFNAYCRCIAVLFSMQLVRLAIDPHSHLLAALSLKEFLLRVISFGPAEEDAKSQRRTPISWPEVFSEAFQLFLKYLAINAIHYYFFIHPYHLNPPVRRPMPLSVSAFVEYYFLAIILYLYMSVYYAFSFGLFALLCGKLSPPIFNGPLLMTSPRDFWGRRWNMLFKQGLHDLIFVPTLRGLEWLSGTNASSVESRTKQILICFQPQSPSPSQRRRSPSRAASPRRRTPEPSSAPIPSSSSSSSSSSSAASAPAPPRKKASPLHLMIAGQMTFVFSGLMHEYMFYVVFGQPILWESFIFFNLHGLLVLLQTVLEHSLPRSFTSRIPAVISTPLTTFLFIYIAPFFFNIFLRVDALRTFHLPLIIPGIYD